MFTPTGIAGKIVSTVEGTELDADSRPLNSTSSISLELSLISQSGDPITISCANELRLEFPLGEGWEFGNEIITLYDPDGTAHDVRKVIAENGGIIPLADLNGTYESEVPYATITITFETPPPEVDTLPATDIRDKSARLKGKIIDDGEEDCQYRFSYWKEGGSITTTDWRGSINAGEEFSQYIYGLDPVSTYYFRAEARNSGGSTEGGLESFVTHIIYSPTISTSPATSIGKTSAILEGLLENDGYDEGSESCDYRFSYWTEGGSNVTTDWEGSIYQGDTFSALISGLTPNTLYYFTAEGKNSAGESSGSTKSFITLPPELEKLLRIENYEGSNSRSWMLGIKVTASNALDDDDQLYAPENGPKIVSLIPEDPDSLGMLELILDARKTLSEEILLEASSISSGEPKALTAENKLQLCLEDPNSTITIQPYDPNSPAQLAYDISELTNNGKNTGTIQLFDPNNPERTHAFFILNPNSRIAQWPLDEPSGNIAEDKINGYDGTIHGNPEREQGKTGGALSLDGVDDYIETPFILNPSEGPFSIYTWIKGDSPGTIIYQQNGQPWLETSLDGKLAIGLTDGSSTNLTSQEQVTNNEWHKVGVVWDGSKRYLYIDGEQAAKDARNLNNLQSSAGGLYIGRNEQGFFKGSIDDIIIYNIPVRDVFPQKPEPANFEGFESGDFSKFNWNHDNYNTGIGQWIVTSESPYSGNFCAKGFNDSEVIGNTYLASEEINCKEGEISGWVNVNTDYGRGLSLFMDSPAGNNHVAHWGGEGEEEGWQYFSYPVSAGNHVFIFRFTKLDPESMGEYAYIDNITFPIEYQQEIPEPEIPNVEGFESGDFSKFNWNPDDYNTNGQWAVTFDEPYSGNYSAKATNNNKGGNAYLTVTVDCQDGEISFWRKISSPGNDGLYFIMDDRTNPYTGKWNGEQDWEHFSYPVTAGSHKFIWFYKQDQEITEGEAAWIDDITFPLKD